MFEYLNAKNYCNITFKFISLLVIKNTNSYILNLGTHKYFYNHYIATHFHKLVRHLQHVILWNMSQQYVCMHHENAQIQKKKN